MVQLPSIFISTTLTPVCHFAAVVKTSYATFPLLRVEEKLQFALPHSTWFRTVFFFLLMESEGSLTFIWLYCMSFYSNCGVLTKLNLNSTNHILEY